MKILRELKNLEDAMEEINNVEESATEIIIESAERKLNAIEKEKTKMNELGEDLRIETVKTRMKEKLVNFKMKNKEIARKKIESKIEIKAEIINKRGELKLEILREIRKLANRIQRKNK